MQPLSGNQRADLLTALMNMSRALRLPRKMHLCRSSSNVPRLPSLLGNATNPHVLLTFDEMHNPVRLPRETTSERQKVVRTCSVFNILTSKCASRYNGAHFHFQKCSEREVLLAFPLANVLRARTEHFSALRSHKSLEKHSESRLSYLFARLDLLSSEIFPFVIFFVLFFSSLTLPISAFHLSVLSEV